MNHEINDIEALLVKCLADEASADEQHWLEQWRKESAANEKHYRQIEFIFRNAPIGTGEKYDTAAAWIKVNQKMHRAKSFRIGLEFSQILKVAAAILIVSSVGFWLYKNQGGEPVAIKFASTDRVVRDTLPNGLPVVLNKQTQLNVSYQSAKNMTTVTLVGEAGFTVNPGVKGELLVQADKALIRHIGTIFNVRAYPSEETIEVTVTEGKVQFFTAGSEGIFIEAGGKGVFNKKTGELVAAAASPNVMAYKTKSFVFERTDLLAVVRQLNSVYDKKIEIADHLKNCPVTVDFDNEDIGTIAEVLAETLGLTVTATSTGFTLKGNSCQ